MKLFVLPEKKSIINSNQHIFNSHAIKKILTSYPSLFSDDMLIERVDFMDSLRRAARPLRSGSLNDWLRLKPAEADVDVPILLPVPYELRLVVEPDNRLWLRFECLGV